MNRVGPKEGDVLALSGDRDVAEGRAQREEVVVETADVGAEARIGQKTRHEPGEDARAHEGRVGHANKERRDDDHARRGQEPSV